MKENEDKLLEKLVDNVMKNTVLERTSSDFTSKVMSEILATQTTKTIVYKPIISKPVLLLIIGGVIALFVYALTNSIPKKSWFDSVNVESVFKNINIPSFKFSKIMLYCTLFTLLMLLIQISFLKKHFEKYFEQ